MIDVKSVFVILCTAVRFVNIALMTTFCFCITGLRRYFSGITTQYTFEQIFKGSAKGSFGG